MRVQDIFTWRRARERDRESGAALLTVMLAGAILTAVAVVGATVSINNLKNAGRDRVAGGAMGAAEAGIAEAISYLATQGVGRISCSPTCGVANPWGSSASPQVIAFPDGRSAEVWVEVVQAFSPPTVPLGTYKIHSYGTDGTGPGARRLEQTVTAKPIEIPIGVYAEQIQISGTPQTFKESVFSKTCIQGRDKMTFGTQLDAYFGIMPAAHSVQWISTKNGNCAANNNNNIHRSGACNSSYPYDRDAQGGPVSSPCAPVNNSSLFTQAMLDGYGKALSPSQLEALRSRAKAQGSYYTSTSGWAAPNPATYPSAVLFFDVGPNDTVTIQNELDAYDWNGECSSTPKTLIVVVNNSSKGNGGVRLNSNANLSGGLFVQKGYLQFNGTATWTGTIYADTIEKWNGNATSQLTSCFLQNFPGGLLQITPTRFREVDR